MTAEKPLNFSVQITAELDALKVSLKVTVSVTREEALTDRNKQNIL